MTISLIRLLADRVEQGVVDSAGAREAAPLIGLRRLPVLVAAVFAESYIYAYSHVEFRRYALRFAWEMTLASLRAWRRIRRTP